MGLHRHIEVHGSMPTIGAGKRRGAEDGRAALIEEVRLSGLRGRGGAAFPTARKLRAVAHGGGRPIVVVNAAEREPGSLKDVTLLQSAPHLVLDGGALAAKAVGAEELIVCVCERASDTKQCVLGAVRERARLEGDPMKVSVVSVPGEYVAGHELALVAHLNGAPAKPTFTPPMPFERGVRRRPTLVNNAETLAHLALIARHGADWFRQLGTGAQPGSTLLTLLGPVGHQGVFEIEMGAPLSTLIDAAGGTSTNPRAALVGGYAGTWIDGDALTDLSLSDEDLEPYGASLGAGVVSLLGEDACGVAETVRVARWLADESAGQCGPCVNGLDALAGVLEEIAAGIAGSEPQRRVDQLGALVQRRGACSHPDGTFGFIASAMEVFRSEMEWHAQHGPCQKCKRPSKLPLPPGVTREPPRKRAQA
jgi:NADH:ubiquinone oxidoreductase subunit F (NADH-binding)